MRNNQQNLTLANPKHCWIVSLLHLDFKFLFPKTNEPTPTCAEWYSNFSSASKLPASGNQSVLKGNQQLKTFRKSKQCRNLLWGTCLVNLSVRIFTVAIFCTLIIDCDLKKWHLTSMCLVILWWTWSFAKHISLRLSQYTIAWSWSRLRSLTRSFN